MNRAEERALEKYPLMADNDKEGLEALKYIGIECECVSVFNEMQEAKQAYFIEGYHQAEKDNELTWENIKDILNIYEEVIDMDFCEDIYGEVLKRFKDFKERKEKIDN